jgi:cysteinyl-tRNA synthetase
MQYLGETFDIHAGGEDLVFPHHENEIAQSEAATGRPFVRYWIHNGFVNWGAEKMSKSLGNVLTLKELLRHHEPEALRLYLLGTHYRNPLDFATERVAEAARALERFRNLFEEADRLAAKGTPAPGRDQGLLEDVAEARRLFEEAMDDDFNTAQAVAVLFDLAHRLQSFKSKVIQGEAAAGAFLLGVGELLSLGRVLGLFDEPSRPSRPMDPELQGRIEALVRARAEARQRLDWASADRLRDELARLRVTVEDGPEGTTWKWKP